MKIALLLFALCFLLPQALLAQRHYLITFKDKGPEAAWLRQHPEAVVSPRALERWERTGAKLTNADLPVSATYLKHLKRSHIRVVQKSKWLNTVLVRTCQDEGFVRAASPAIASVKLIESTGVRVKNPEKKFASKGTAAGRLPFNYGVATGQIEQINLDCLHDKGYAGTGVLIAMLDAGWEGADTLRAYDSLRNQNRILASRNFVNPAQTVYGTHSHGTIVLSVMAANLPGQLVGGAPRATYVLALTEDVSQEVHQEELNWAAAAEWADSLGADVITSSLGYKEFDLGQGDYTNAQLNGDFAIVTRAADYAASRGIIVVNSAGNSGASGISAPCDGDSVLCVGAVDNLGNIAGFSGVGPTGDGRIKPDVVAWGVNTQSVFPNGAIGGVNGTSLSCPLVASLVACLRQAHPNVSNMAIFNAVKQSANRFNNPDNQYGAGLPDACKADSLLQLVSSPALVPGVSSFTVQPTISSGQITVFRNRQEVGVSGLRIVNLAGQQIQKLRWNASQNSTPIDISKLPEGMYLLQVEPENGKPLIYKFVKQ